VPWLTSQVKAYDATLALGTETDTLDAEGREVRTLPPSDELCKALSAAGRGEAAPFLDDAIAQERARTSQTPPVYSAIRTDGERAFERARRGELFTMTPRDVRVERLEIVGCTAAPPQIALTMVVAKGYYVRSLARDLANRLQTAGHLTSLRRTRSGKFSIQDAVTPQSPAEALRERVVPLPVAALLALPSARLTDAGATHARHGRPIPSSEIGGEQTGPCAWLDAAGRLVAVGEVDPSGVGKVIRGFGA
jgi:tRNA pseudouridine55 synthase